MAEVTFIYCYPTALETAEGREAVDEALACLASELSLGEGVRLRQGSGNSIVVEDVEPEVLWKAMDRAVPDWEDRRIFYAPVFF